MGEDSSQARPVTSRIYRHPRTLYIQECPLRYGRPPREAQEGAAGIRTARKIPTKTEGTRRTRAKAAVGLEARVTLAISSGASGWLPGTERGESPCCPSAEPQNPPDEVTTRIGKKSRNKQPSMQRRLLKPRGLGTWTPCIRSRQRLSCAGRMRGTPKSGPATFRSGGAGGASNPKHRVRFGGASSGKLRDGE
jgi:hypothetical protein